ncbi:uncharacterized protein [Antedon mediterranea]|uniref:uncharacterized protein n=1 Tax=Antedon mediterranea TaxID=105859 RepID=UPI003AF48835
MWPSSTKEDFYASLAEHLEQVKRHNINLIIGDFNARIGADSHLTHPDVVGRCCYHDETNNNGERLKSGLSIHLLTSLRLTKKKAFKRPKLDWRKLEDPEKKEQFQLELSNRFQTLSLDDQSLDISERYESFATSVGDAAEKVLGRQKKHELHSWVSEETTNLKLKGDEVKKRFLLSKSPQARAREGVFNTRLSDSYKDDEAASLHQQMEDLRIADERGHYATTWNIIHTLFVKNPKKKIKVKLRNGEPPENEEHLLEEWKNYFSSILNNDSGLAPSDLPAPASDDLPICTDPPTREETAEAITAMKTNKAAGLDCATAEALQGGGEQMIDTIYAFCSEVY